MSSDLVGLYCHIPFCEVKCFYCDFAAIAHHGHLADRYLKALEKEALAKPRHGFDTVYIGGGTPSELSAPQITELFAIIKRAYPALDPLETTFECNPESLDQDKLHALARAGVTRLSIGLQTADPVLLKGIGRRHTLGEFRSVYEMAKRMKAFDLSVDLMYNLPGQSVTSCLESLDYAIELNPEHLSLYGLQIEDQTLFSKKAIVPDQDDGREMFERCLDRLAEAGYRHYEISNFAKPGHEAKHNLIYWHDGEYEGLGCGASRYMGGVRSGNDEKPTSYMDKIEKGLSPIENSETLEGKAKVGEAFMLALRLVSGFKPSRRMMEFFQKELLDLESRHLLTIDEQGFTALTRDGLFLANDAFREFVPPFRAERVTK